MCTAISLLSRKNENVFGRTMDFHCSLDPQFAIFPAGCKWEKNVRRYMYGSIWRGRDQPACEEPIHPF